MKLTDKFIVPHINPIKFPNRVYLPVFLGYLMIPIAVPYSDHYVEVGMKKYIHPYLPVKFN